MILMLYPSSFETKLMKFHRVHEWDMRWQLTVTMQCQINTCVPFKYKKYVLQVVPQVVSRTGQVTQQYKKYSNKKCFSKEL